VVSQHLEDLASLRATRSVLLRSPHVELHRLERLDVRIAAHLDGMVVAGNEGYRMALQELERPGVGAIFAVAALAALRGDAAQLGKLLALAEALPDDLPRALASALGWVSPQDLRGWTGTLLASDDPWQRWLGLAACAAHRVDPGSALVSGLAQEAPKWHRLRAARFAGQLGRVDLLPALRLVIETGDAALRVQAAWTAVLLGNRAWALPELRRAAVDANVPLHLQALQLYLLSASPDAAKTAVRELASAGASVRTLIRAAAWTGDVQAVPWLIQHMTDPARARLAGEAFSFITGANLALLDLEVKGEQPATAAGPSDDPNDDNVALDEDESLPWPDVSLVQAWWRDNSARLPRSGTRCFMGAEPGRSHCAGVLNAAGQRARYAAALLLALDTPGRPLFNTAAPSHRQRRALADVATLT
jgi:uncharacterized protein (TIGR02270 family)